MQFRYLLSFHAIKCDSWKYGDCANTSNNRGYVLGLNVVLICNIFKSLYIYRSRCKRFTQTCFSFTWILKMTPPPPKFTVNAALKLLDFLFNFPLIMFLKNEHILKKQLSHTCTYLSIYFRDTSIPNVTFLGVIAFAAPSTTKTVKSIRTGMRTVVTKRS